MSLTLRPLSLTGQGKKLFPATVLLPTKRLAEGRVSEYNITEPIFNIMTPIPLRNDSIPNLSPKTAVRKCGSAAIHAY